MKTLSYKSIFILLLAFAMLAGSCVSHRGASYRKGLKKGCKCPAYGQVKNQTAPLFVTTSTKKTADAC